MMIRTSLLATAFLAFPAFGQDNLLDLLGEEETGPVYTTASFKTTRVINSHSLENTAHGVLDFRISHRFGFLSGGVNEFFGLDNADVRLGLDYGISDRLMVGVAGDITPDELAPLLDATFGDLPDGGALPELAPVAPRVSRTEVVRLAIPQSVVVFGHAGLDRHDPDYYAGYVANYILGGGGFSSRLLEEVREKRGLAYSAYSYLHELDKAPLWLGGVATNNQQVGQSLAIVRAELARMARGELDETDLADARTYLTGSFPLRLTSNDQIAKMLVGMLVHHLGRDFLERRNALIEAVTLADLRRVSARLFSGELLVSVVGDPEGL